MKTISWLFFLLIGPMQVLVAQPQDSISISHPGFKLLRSDENYAYLRQKVTQKNFWEKLKYISLSENNYFTIGGDFRSESQRLDNEEWRSGNDDMPLFLRFMLHADWHVGDHLRIFTQLKSGFAIGRNGPPFFLNVDRLDLHQLFLAYRIGESTIELGRRELIYGSRRLISIREGTNVRQSFDGVRWIWQNSNHRLDLLFYLYNPQQIGVFDNRINSDQLLWGGYYVWQAGKEQSSNFDIYYLGVNNENPRFEEGNSREIRHSFGIRHWGSIGLFRYNNEGVYQIGTFGDGNIRAWTISTELYYSIQAPMKPIFGIKAEIISGDENPEDGNLQTFNPLYPRGGYFGLLAVIGPSNLIDAHPSVKLQPFKGWEVNLDWDFFWRHQLGDGIYFPSGRLNVLGSGSEERFIGHQAGVQIGHTINRFMEIEASYFYFFAGAFLKDVSDGANFSQFGTSFSFKF